MCSWSYYRIAVINSDVNSYLEYSSRLMRLVHYTYHSLFIVSALTGQRRIRFQTGQASCRNEWKIVKEDKTKRENKSERDRLLQMRRWQHAKSNGNPHTLEHSLVVWTWKDCDHTTTTTTIHFTHRSADVTCLVVGKKWVKGQRGITCESTRWLISWSLLLNGSKAPDVDSLY